MGERSDACPEFEERVLESVFAPAPDAALDAHLATCDRCRRAREGFVRASQALHQALASAEEGLLVRDTGARPVANRWVRLGLLAAVALFVAVAAWAIARGAAGWSGSGKEPEREVRAGSPVAPAAGTEARAPRQDDAPPPATSPATAPTPLVVLEVVKDDGRPASGARLQVRVGDGVVGEVVADAGGHATLPTRETPVELRIVTDFAPPETRTVGMGASGFVRIALPAGGVVAGRVLVDDAPPREPVRLTLWLKNPIASEEHEVFLRELKFHKRTPPILVQDTDAAGRFEFRSLPEGWRGLIEVPQRYALQQRRPVRRALRLDGPASEVELRLKSLPFLTGRIVTGDGRAAPHSWILARREESDVPLGGTLETDEQGRFVIVFEDGPAGPVRLRVTDAENRGRRELTIDAAGPAGRDVGDVSLLSLRGIPFVALDERGAPVAGAVAASGASASEPTGPDGRGTIALGPEATAFHVGAPGRRVVDAPVPAGAAEPVSVTMPRANKLEVRVVPPKGVDVTGMKVVLTSEVELLASARPVPDPAHRATGGAPWNDLLSRSGEFVVSYPLERSGSIRAVGLRPGAPFTVRLKDTLDAVLHEGVWTLGEGEERLVEIPLAAPPRRLEVRVTDLEGRPLEDVSVEIGSGEPLPRGRPGEPIRIFERLRSVARSDAAGLFRFEGLYADVVDLSVSKPGFVSWRDRALRVPADRAPVVVRLEPGQTVQLRIHDQAGRPVLRARIPEVGGAAARLVEDGNFRWVDLPRGTTTLRVIVAGRTYELAHDTAVPEARLVVPVHGALRVRWEVLPDQTGPLHVQLTPTGSDGAALTEVVHPAPGRPEGDVLLPLVLPGEYHVELRRSPGMREASAPVSAAGTVRVAPDATAEVVLTR